VLLLIVTTLWGLELVKLFQDIVSVLNPKDQRKVFIVIFLLLILAIAETAGVGMVFAFIKIAADPDIIRNGALTTMYRWTGLSESEFLMYTGGVVILVFLIKICFSFFARWYQYSFTYRSHYEITMQILGGYVAMSYDMLIANSGPRLSHRILVETDKAVSGVLIAGLNILAELLVVLGVLTLLFWHDGKLAMVASISLSVLYGTIFLAVRNIHSRLGDRVNEENIRRYSISNRVIEGGKELRINSSEQYFLEQFSNPARAIMYASIKQQLLQEVPRNIIEFIVFGGILLFILFALGSGRELAGIIPTIALYALGAFRIMPSLNRIVTGVNQMRFNRVAVKNIVDELNKLTEIHFDIKPCIKPLAFAETIQLENVTYYYPTASTPVLIDISLTIRKGTSVAFVGPTGSGKSTLVDILIGVLEPKTGQVRIDGCVLTQANHKAWFARIGYVPQSVFLFDDSVTANIAFGIPNHNIDMDRVIQAAKAAYIDKFIEQALPDGYATSIGDRGVRLSGGQRQRIGIARALYRSTDVIVFDEATSALDGQTESIVQQAIFELRRQHTIVTIAHRLTTVKDCDDIFVLEKGRIRAHGTYNELLKISDTFRDMERLHVVA